ncbi:MAG: DUF4926 domain-containing protein [Propionibacteriaceae bacterium]|jgi:hypothetical protein|nr:DUF4926 domain-containing protein [Propionibacteriaceae bacterium]
MRQTVFYELDMVQASRRLSDEIDRGCVGTIVMVLDPGKAYLVEFFDSEHHTIGIPDVRPSDIEPWRGNKKAG